MKLISTAVAAIMFFFIPAYSQTVATSHMEIPQIAEKGEDVIDYFLNSDWQNAKPLVDEIVSSQAIVVSAMREHNLPKADIYIYQYLVYRLQSLTEKGEQPIQASLAANQITAFLIGLQGLTPQQVPVEIAWMDYLGREIMLQARAKVDREIIALRTKELAESWEQVKPDILARGGSEPALQIDNILVELKNTKDYNKLTADGTGILDLVDDLEKLYK